jgi:hypothetical protein
MIIKVKLQTTKAKRRSGSGRSEMTIETIEFGRRIKEEDLRAKV